MDRKRTYEVPEQGLKFEKKKLNWQDGTNGFEYLFDIPDFKDKKGYAQLIYPTTQRLPEDKELFKKLIIEVSARMIFLRT